MAAFVIVSVAIMAHPSRRRFVDELTARLDTPAEVVWDRHNDRWDTGRRSLLAYDTAADVHLVIQDDALVCRNLVGGVARAAEVAGERPLGLYLGKVRPYTSKVQRAFRAAADAGATWVEMDGPHWGVAIALPTSHIDELVKHGDLRNGIRNYDAKIADFYTRQRISCWYTVPSLVDHRPVGENPSLIAGRTGNRRAHAFLGADVDATAVEWDPRPFRLLGNGWGPRPDGVNVYRSKFNGFVVEVEQGDPRDDRYASRPGAWERI